MGSFKKLFGRRNKTVDHIDGEDLENLNAEGRGMVRGIVDLSDTTVKEVMVPRIDTVFVPENLEIEEINERMVDSGHSRFPVYQDTIDNVVGILYVKDLLPHLVRQEPVFLKDIIRAPYFVPESMKLDALLREMKQRRVHIAVSVDEYGGVSGIISLEDILEKIVGDIQDEFDNEAEEIVEEEPGTWICDARVNIEDLNEALEVKLPDDEIDSLGGFVFDLFGRIPSRYEKISWEGLLFIIQSVEGHKIKQVKIKKEALPDEDF